MVSHTIIYLSFSSGAYGHLSVCLPPLEPGGADGALADATRDTDALTLQLP